ncbi:MAG: hypothetical protein SGI77_20100 [Pirellulaceae bacterium]|nr:hypothetical protein [Pirellulaceae bacterium]
MAFLSWIRITSGTAVLSSIFSLLAWTLAEEGEAQVNIHETPSDLVVPLLSDGKPEAGKRVREKLVDHADWELYHVVYLPTDWKRGQKLPVIIEFPGNGGFLNELGDVSTGRVEDCKLGYGMSGGRGFIWVCLPFVNPVTGQHSLTWWGDADATASYCRKVVAHVCDEYSGDPNSIILTGFSRGAIACSYIGLRDEQTANLWRAMFLHSHYDGVRQWKYPDSDAESARARWARFQDKPQFVTQEKSVDNIRQFLQNSDTKSITLVALPILNHTDTWVLKDIPERKKLRDWLDAALR